jgi:hypothetical protein
MYSLVSMVFGGGLVVLVYGLSFLPSATLVRSDDAEESRDRASQDRGNPYTADEQSLVAQGSVSTLPE